MNAEGFQRLVTALEGLTTEQRTQVTERPRTLDTRADGERLIAERSGTPAACPYCASSELVRFGRLKGQQRLRRPQAPHAAAGVCPTYL